MRPPRLLMALGLVGLLAVACADGTSSIDAKAKPGQGVVEATPVDPEAETTPEEPNASATPTTTSTVPATPIDGLEALELSLSSTAAAGRFRFRTAVGTHWSSPGVGIEINSPIDADRPALRGVVVDGMAHYVQDLGLLFEGLAGVAQPDVQDAVDQAVLEMWTSPDRLVMDTSGYQPLADLDPDYDFGPFSPGVWFVDLAGFVELGREEIVGFLIGNGAGDPGGLASRIGYVLRDVQRTDEETLTGTTTYGEFMAATGQNAETVARGIAGGLALTLPVSVDVLTEVFMEIYDATPVTVTVVTSGTGELRGIRTVADFSNIFSEMFQSDALDGRVPSTDLARVEQLFAGTNYTIETVTAYEIDPSITLPPPPETGDDRTDRIVEFLKQSGLL